MKKGVAIFTILFVISSLTLAGVLALSETEGVQKAYKCFNEKIDNQTCSKLGTEEQIFSLLTSGKCKTELLNNSFNKTCWPNGDCDLEMTAKAALALDNAGANTDLPVEWLLKQKGVSSDLNWYLEVDSERPLSCTASYGGDQDYSTYTFKIGEDKKIDQNAGRCLTKTTSGYWFKIAPSCYEEEFEISCNESFVSTLLFQEKNSLTYHISPEVHGANSGGTTVEKIDSYCFLNGGSCDILGSLWSTTVLNILGNNVSEFLPYLETTAPNFPQYLPESFLYILTGSLQDKTNLLGKQNLADNLWRISGGKGRYYDTALALLPFQNQDLTQKTKAKTELLNLQAKSPSGCWENDNLVSTGFILYSLWPKGTNVIDGGDDVTFCSEAGYSCVTNSASCSGTEKPQYKCEGTKICCASSGDRGLSECEDEGYSCGFTSRCNGEVLGDYSCGDSTAYVCCDSSKTNEITCNDKNGEVCSSDEECSIDGNVLQTDSLRYGETCCTGAGECVKKQDIAPSCQNDLDNSRICRTVCESGEKSNGSYTCSDNTGFCCVKPIKQSSGSYWWIWILFFLVILVVIGIIYRDKIREWLDERKAKKGSGSSSNSRGMPPRFPPGYSRVTRITPPTPRRVIPESRPPQRFVPKQKSPKELDEVLKKLKEIGK